MYRKSLTETKTKAESESYLLVDSQELTGVSYGLDIGGSLAKLAYVTKDETQPDKRRVYTKSFSKDDVDQVVAFLRLQGNLPPPQSTVTVTGFGSLVNKDKLETGLHAKLQLVTEFECFIKTLVWSVNHLTLKEVFYAPTEKSLVDAKGTAMSWAQIAMTMAPDAEKPLLESMESQPPPPGPEPISYYVSDLPESCDKFPCLLTMLGSGIGYYVAFEDKRMQFLEPSHYAGRSLLALSRLLIGIKDFGEFMDLAAKGNISGVDTCGFHMKKGCPEDASAKLYNSYPDMEPAYHLGEAVESDGPFKKEDIAASLVRNFAVQVVNLSHILAKMYKVNRILFAGSLPQHPHMRASLERHMLERLFTIESKNKDIKFGFLRNGGAYGAIGTLLL